MTASSMVLITAGPSPIPISGNRNKDGFGDACVQSRIRPGVTVGADPIIGKGVFLLPGVVLGDNVTIGAGSRISSFISIARDVTIEDNTRIGLACPPPAPRTRICVRIRAGSVIGESATIENDVKLGRNVDVGANATVESGSDLPNGTIVPCSRPTTPPFS
jgi:UDP-3-O-[3-hydroxymyristoyl] glucosamine N-acyltransferase